MTTKVVLTITKGSGEGTTYSFTEKESLFLGRADDCHIRFVEDNVSRYHCMLEICPPLVSIRDFGSLNGTYLNGTLIDKRPKDTDAGKAADMRFNERKLKHGDRIQLGSTCEIQILLQPVKRCELCGEEITSNAQPTAGGYICAACADKPRQALHRPATTDSGGLSESETAAVLAFIQQLRDGSDHALVPGYRPARRIGLQGGMSRVYLLENSATGKRIVLKLMRSDMAGDEHARAQFMREAMLGGQLQHENIVRQLTAGELGGCIFIVSEYCEGGSVDEFIARQGGPLDTDLAVSITLMALRGLHYAHTAEIVSPMPDGSFVRTTGLVHRDFKPGNLFISIRDDDVSIKVADFGLSKAFEAAGLSGQTRTGAYAGTSRFMPIKQIFNYRYAKPDVDVWAAAVTLYYMLTHTYPKPTEGMDEWHAALQPVTVPIRERNPSIPARLAAVVDLALHEDAGNHFETHFRTAAEFFNALMEVR